MSKIYIDTVKYIIRANVEIDGLVEKPDVVGAIFGQTEGLLGEELDLRELQKNGRIGRIEVNIRGRGGKSIGEIEIPSSLDVVETSIIAAALETVDRVGPCEARINVQRVEDTRELKRKKLIDRAKGIVKRLVTTEMPERKEITEQVRQEVKTAEIATFGPERLPAGPNIDSFESIILVEGRADVINLLKNDINNVIAIGGATVPKTIVDLCRRKETTLFVDGDRGGDIILREVGNVAELDYVVRAPPGREVEELSRKEILKALRARVPIEQAEAALAARSHRRRYEESQEMARHVKSAVETREPRYEPMRTLGRPTAPTRPEPEKELKKEETGMPTEITESLRELEGTLKARIYDQNMKQIKEVAVREITGEVPDNASAIVMDGIITQRLVDLAESKNIKILAGVRMGNVFRKPGTLQIYAKES